MKTTTITCDNCGIYINHEGCVHDLSVEKSLKVLARADGLSQTPILAEKSPTGVVPESRNSTKYDFSILKIRLELCFFCYSHAVKAALEKLLEVKSPDFVSNAVSLE